MIAAVIVTAALGVAGCSTGSTGGAATSTPTAASASPSTASTQQFASIIAQASPDIRKYDSIISECWSQYGAPPKSDLSCTLAPDTQALQAKVLAKKLTDLGTAPTEIQALLTETLRTAGNADKFGSACTSKCSSADYLIVSAASKKLVETLDGWKPYGA